MRQRIPTLFAASVVGWYGIDFAFIRDLTGQFTYYGAIPQQYMDNVFGLVGIAAAFALLVGAFCKDERVERVGYVLASVAFGLFAAGMLLNGIVVRSNPTAVDWASAMTPGLNYLLLSLWMLLTALGAWDRATRR